MKKRWFGGIFCLMILCPSSQEQLLATTPSVFESESTLWVGHSRREITPPVGTPLAGYGRRRGKPSTSIHDPLYVRALAIRHQEQTVLFLSADLVLIDEPLRKRVLQKIKKELPEFKDTHLLLAATHTHSGAGAIGKRTWEKFIMGKFKKNIFENVTDQMAEAALEAATHLTPAHLESGEIAIDHLLENRMDKNLTYFPKLQVLRFKDQHHQIQAQMILMAAHPTWFKDPFAFSADSPGAITQLLEKQFPSSVALFLNGASGDLRPHLEQGSELPEKAFLYGKTIAEKILQMHFEPIASANFIQIRYDRLSLPRVKARAGWLKVPSLLGNRIFPRKAVFQTIRIGPMVFLAFPGELGSEIEKELSDYAHALGLQAWVVGYANDYLGYVVPKRFYLNRDHYESQASFYGANMDSFVQKHFRRQLVALLSAEEFSTAHPAGTLSWRSQLPVLAVEGPAYHRGFEEGRLLGPQIKQATDDIFSYFRSEVPVPGINRVLISTVLNRAWKQMEPYLTYEEKEHIRGIAEGAGMSLKKIQQIHAMPEVYPSWCANGAYWGKATQHGNLIAIRNLDWNRKIGVHHMAAVKVQKMRGQSTYVNIGYYGFMGVLSGLNEHGISIGQIGAESIDETMRGVPMPMLIKRILETSKDLDTAQQILKNASRTRGYNYVISDALHHQAIAVETTKSTFQSFQTQDPIEQTVSYAVTIPDVVLRSDTAIDPVVRNLQTASKGDPKKPGLETPAGSAYEIRYRKQADLVQASYGQITPTTAIQIAKEIAPGSNIQSVIYAFPEFFVANAQGDSRAVDRPYERFYWDELVNNP